MKVFFQNRLVDEKNAHVSVFDHGFLYGDGIYETVRAYDYNVFHWPDHFKRLKQSAARLELKTPWSSRFLLKGVVQVLKANRAPNGSVRITVARGPGPLGLDPRLCPKPTLAMLLFPPRPVARLQKTGISIGIPKVRRNHPLCLHPQIKANNSLNTILAKMEAQRMGVFEAVLLNLDGHLTEGTTTNIFFVRAGRIYTPALSCGLLEGVTRGAAIRLARKAGYRVQEGRYTLSDLRRASEIFLTSTTLEIVPVVKVVAPSPLATFPSAEAVPSVQRRIGPMVPRSLARSVVWRGRPGPVTRQLHRLFYE